MASIRRRRAGVWEVRAFTGYDDRGRPTQVSRTVHGTKKDVKRVAAQLTVKPARRAGAKKVAGLLDEWVETKAPTWAPLTLRDRRSQVSLIKKDPIAKASVGSLGVADIDRWVARMRKAGVGEGAIGNRHSALRAALQQAVRWELIDSNPAAKAPVRRPRRLQRDTMSADEVHRVLEAAGEISEFAALALRLAAETGARRSELAEPVAARAPMRHAAPSSQNNAGGSAISGRMSSRFQRNTRSTWSSIGTHRGRGHDPRVPLPKRTWILPNGPRSKCRSERSGDAASSDRGPQ